MTSARPNAAYSDESNDFVSEAIEPVSEPKENVYKTPKKRVTDGLRKKLRIERPEVKSKIVFHGNEPKRSYVAGSNGGKAAPFYNMIDPETNRPIAEPWHSASDLTADAIRAEVRHTNNKFDLVYDAIGAEKCEKNLKGLETGIFRSLFEGKDTIGEDHRIANAIYGLMSYYKTKYKGSESLIDEVFIAQCKKNMCEKMYNSSEISDEVSALKSFRKDVKKNYFTGNENELEKQWRKENKELEKLERSADPLRYDAIEKKQEELEYIEEELDLIEEERKEMMDDINMEINWLLFGKESGLIEGIIKGEREKEKNLSPKYYKILEAIDNVPDEVSRKHLKKMVNLGEHTVASGYSSDPRIGMIKSNIKELKKTGKKGNHCQIMSEITQEQEKMDILIKRTKENKKRWRGERSIIGLDETYHMEDIPEIIDATNAFYDSKIEKIERTLSKKKFEKYMESLDELDSIEENKKSLKEVKKAVSSYIGSQEYNYVPAYASLLAMKNFQKHATEENIDMFSGFMEKEKENFIEKYNITDDYFIDVDIEVAKEMGNFRSKGKNSKDIPFGVKEAQCRFVAKKKKKGKMALAWEAAKIKMLDDYEYHVLKGGLKQKKNELKSEQRVLEHEFDEYDSSDVAEQWNKYQDIIEEADKLVRDYEDAINTQKNVDNIYPNRKEATSVWNHKEEERYELRKDMSQFLEETKIEKEPRKISSDPVKIPQELNKFVNAIMLKNQVEADM